MKNMDKLVVNGVNEHINNGGVLFGVTNEKGPTIEISASHFGHITNTIKLHVTKESLRNLGEMFIQAAEAEYGEDYVCATESRIFDKDTLEVISDQVGGESHLQLKGVIRHEAKASSENIES